MMGSFSSSCSYLNRYLSNYPSTQPASYGHSLSLLGPTVNRFRPPPPCISRSQHWRCHSSSPMTCTTRGPMCVWTPPAPSAARRERHRRAENAAPARRRPVRWSDNWERWDSRDEPSRRRYSVWVSRRLAGWLVGLVW